MKNADKVAEMLVKTIYGHELYAAPGDRIAERIRKKGIYDKPAVSFLREILSNMAAPVTLDIGTNIGNHLLAVSPFVKQAYGFEPQPVIYDFVSRSLKRNHIQNCKVFPYGLGDENKKLEFYINKTGNLGASSFVKEQVQEAHDVVQLEVRIGDEVIRELGLEQLDFIKIDVEGYEPEALKGLENTLARFSPMILMEWTSSKTAQDFEAQKLFETVLDGYRQVAVLSPCHRLCWENRKMAAVGRLLSRLDVRHAWRFVAFQKERQYSNILLYKDEHKPVLKRLSAALPE